MASKGKKIFVWANNIGQPLTEERIFEPMMTMNNYSEAPLLSRKGNNEPSELFKQQEAMRRNRKLLEKTRRKHEHRIMMPDEENLNAYVTYEGTTEPGAFSKEQNRRRLINTLKHFAKTIADVIGNVRNPDYAWLYGVETAPMNWKGGMIRNTVLMQKVYRAFNEIPKSIPIRDRILEAIRVSEIPGSPFMMAEAVENPEAAWNAQQGAWAAEKSRGEHNRGSRAPMANARKSRKARKNIRKTRKSRR
jgi:hypothetical protein